MKEIAGIAQNGDQSFRAEISPAAPGALQIRS
jgi:hypothetical protein